VSEAEVALLRRAYEHFNRTREIDLGVIDEDVEWGLFAGAPEGDALYGHEGVRTWTKQMSSAFERLQIEPQEFVDAGGGQVVVVSRMAARGRGSGMDIEAPLVNVWTFRDGRVTRCQSFTSRDDALAAAGPELG
jgi:ketosteroid isomerase-like protein